MSAIHLYQIYYNEQTRAQLDPGFIPLDNTDNLCPEWYEFWVIKNFLEQNDLADGAFYGFLSPKFGAKTGLTAEQLKALMVPHQADTDVFLVATAWSQLAYFQNPFEQGEFWHPGIFDLSQQVTDALGLGIRLDDMVCCSHNFAFCNYIVARKPYWQAWKKLADAFFELVETRQDVLGEVLRGETSYVSRLAPMRAFVQERLPAIVLQQQRYRTCAIEDVAHFVIARNVFQPSGVYDRATLQMCNLLKYRYYLDGNSEHLRSYRHIRQNVSLIR